MGRLEVTGEVSGTLVHVLDTLLLTELAVTRTVSLSPPSNNLRGSTLFRGHNSFLFVYSAASIGLDRLTVRLQVQGLRNT